MKAMGSDYGEVEIWVESSYVCKQVCKQMEVNVAME